MSTKAISPFMSRALSSNGDSSSDDDVFVNSRLDVISRNCDSNSGHFLDFKMDQGSVTSLFTPSPRSEGNAVIYSVYFCGKYFGEVGLFEPDISILDWTGFRSYIFSSMNLESSDSYVISYLDEEYDKITIQSEDDYQAALKLAKILAAEAEKVYLYIARAAPSSGSGSFQHSLRSLVSSSLRRVNSLGAGGAGPRGTIQPPKKDVTTSTSFQSLDKASSVVSLELNSPGLSPSYLPLDDHRDLGTPQEDYFGDATEAFEKNPYDSAEESNSHFAGVDPATGFSASPICSTRWGPQKDGTECQVPAWFQDYMKQFKADLCVEVSSKIDERFDDAVGGVSANEVAAKLKGLLTGFSLDPDATNGLCCCKNGNSTCHRAFHGPDRVLDPLGKLEREQMSTPISGLDPRDESADFEGGANTQDYFLQKLLKREQEILDFLDATNEKIKRKINDAHSLGSCLTPEVAIEERDRVLARIEDFRHRQSRTTNDIKMLQQSMEVNNEGISRLASHQEPPTSSSGKRELDAKFIEDLSFVDGSKVMPNQVFRKHWAVQNTGTNPWDAETFLVCLSSHRMKPFSEKIRCPPLLPGEVGSVSADFQAPSNPGIYSTEWRFMRTQKLFGNHLWCSVIVPSEVGYIAEDKSKKSTLDITSTSQPDQPYSSDFTDYCDDEHPSVNDSLDNAQILDDNENLPSGGDEERKAGNPTEDEACKKGGGIFAMHPLKKMNAEQLLWFLLYLFKITNPDFSAVGNVPVYKAVKNVLLKGHSKDMENAWLMIENSFLENCLESNLPLEKVINCYKELFGPGPETDLRIKNLTVRYMNKVFSPPERGLDLSDDDNELPMNDKNERKLKSETLSLYQTDLVKTPVSPEKETERTTLPQDSKKTNPLEKSLETEGSFLGEELIEIINSGKNCDEKNSIVLEKILEYVDNLKFDSFTHATNLLANKNHERGGNNLTAQTWPWIHSEVESRVSPWNMSNIESTPAARKEDNCHASRVYDSDIKHRSVGKVMEEDWEDAASSSYSEYSETSLESEDEGSLKVVDDGVEDERLKIDEIEREKDKSPEICLLVGESEDECKCEVCASPESENVVNAVSVLPCEHGADTDESALNSNHDDVGAPKSEQGDDSDHKSEQGLESGPEGGREDESCPESDQGRESGPESEFDDDNELERYQDENELEDDESDYETENPSDRENEVESGHGSEFENGHEVEEESGQGSEIESLLGRESRERMTEDNEEGSDNETDDESASERNDTDFDRDRDYDKFAQNIRESLKKLDTKAAEWDLPRNPSGSERESFTAPKPYHKFDDNQASSSLATDPSSTPDPNDLQKDITSLRENFKQNVQVNLDFEVISRRPPPPETIREVDSPSTSDPLTFQERHFTISSRPPPQAVTIPDSDDESFDGLVFIKDTDIVSSVTPTEPCSPSHPPQINSLLIDDSELSVSCSSFSELDEDDVESACSEEQRHSQNVESSMASSDYYSFLS